jgi:N,N'-diacetyllegionaminate synthase
VKIGSIDLDARVFIVAEIGNNHEGNFDLAQEMVGKAAEAGVNAVKFQTFVPEHYVARSDTARFERLRKFQLSHAAFERLAKQAADLGLIFFSTPFDIESARFLNTIQPVFKISSGDNTFFPLVECVAGFGKPLIVSTGLADLALLDRLHASIQRVWTGNKTDPGLAFLHCVTCYPTPLEQANLGAIATLKNHFVDCSIGYSDHTLGIVAAPYAVAAGARIIEKHFTIDKNFSDFRDHQLSADPAEMRRMVEVIRETDAMLGTGLKVPQLCESDFLSAVRRSIAAARDIPAGTALQESDLTWIRPGTGVAPGNEGLVLGRKTRQIILAGDIIQVTDLSVV